MSTVETGPLDALAAIEPFRRVAAATLASLEGEVVWRMLAPGEVLVEAGTEARELAVVVEGSLRVDLVTPDGATARVAELGPGTIVGEMALLLGGRRSAAVTAVTSAMVVDLSAAGFGRLLAEAPEVGLELAARATRRLRETQVAAHLTDLFGQIPSTILDQLRSGVELVDLRAGQELFAAGEPADAAYVVLAGRLRSRSSGEGATAGDVVEHGPGELVGDRALLDEADRTATLSAVRDTALARLSRERFDVLVDHHPAAMLAVIRRLVARTGRRSTARRAPGRRLSVVVVPHSSDVDVRLVTSQLVAALGPDALHVWSARVDSLLHAPGLAQCEAGGVDDARLTHWLHEAEQDHPVLVYEADREWTRWTERAVRQADEVLVVAHAADDRRAPGPLEARVNAGLGAHAPRRTLVLLHGATAERASGTAAWLDAREVDRHVHVRAHRGADMARLARVVSGTATGLVLGGGGARGAAHLGVVRALHHLGVPVDTYGGTSIGSVMALAAALEYPDDELVPRVAEIFSGLLDYTLPVVSLLKGERITRAITEAADGRSIEDLWTPWFCVSTNLTQQAEVVHRRGDLATAARASVAIPGVLPPVPFGSDLLIDGGSMNNLPLDRMREQNPTGTVIAVDVAPPRGPSAKDATTPVVSGWGQIAGRVVPGRRVAQVPGIVTTLLGSTIVSAMRDRHAHVANGLADLYLDLDLRGHGLLDFESIAAIAVAGEEAALPRIEAWLAEREGGPDAPADPA